jgi:hypothetical protein
MEKGDGLLGLRGRSAEGSRGRRGFQLPVNCQWMSLSSEE